MSCYLQVVRDSVLLSSGCVSSLCMIVSWFPEVVCLLFALCVLFVLCVC